MDQTARELAMIEHVIQAGVDVNEVEVDAHARRAAESRGQETPD